MQVLTGLLSVIRTQHGSVGGKLRGPEKRGAEPWTALESTSFVTSLEHKKAGTRRNLAITQGHTSTY